MGNCVLMHATKVQPDPQKFKALPKSIDYAFCRDDETDAFYIFTFNSGGKYRLMFDRFPPRDIPDDLPVATDSLNVVYEALRKAGLHHSFYCWFVNLNTLLSQAQGNSVCSIVSDDEGVDFACISTCGRLDRLRFGARDLEILYAGGGVEIQPLRYRYYDEGEEFEDTDVELTDLGYLNDPARNIRVLPRNKDHSDLMYLIVSEELEMFLSAPKPPPDLENMDLEELHARLFDRLYDRLYKRIQTSLESRNPERKPWWKFWK
jgi:hypothetical protein